jgi:hypothetical protein
MSIRVLIGFCTAATFAATTGTVAQQSQTQTRPRPDSTARTQAAPEITIVGCVQRHADYIQAQGGTSTARGNSAANQYVLTSIGMSGTASAGAGVDRRGSAAPAVTEPSGPTSETAQSNSRTAQSPDQTGQNVDATAPTEGAQAGQTASQVARGQADTSGQASVGTSGAASTVYMLNGQTDALRNQVGKRVEITGRLMGHTVGAAVTPGATVGLDASSGSARVDAGANAGATSGAAGAGTSGAAGTRSGTTSAGSPNTAGSSANLHGDARAGTPGHLEMQTVTVTRVRPMAGSCDMQQR